jgi:hypothetical protein
MLAWKLGGNWEEIPRAPSNTVVPLSGLAPVAVLTFGDENVKTTGPDGLERGTGGWGVVGCVAMQVLLEATVLPAGP